MTTPGTPPNDGQREAEAERATQSPDPASSGQGKISDHLANQRTLLAWARTGISIMALGFVVARFGLLIRELSVIHTNALPTGAANWFGIALILFGAVILGLSLVRYLQIARGIDEGNPRLTPELDIVMSVGLILAGVALAIYLAVTS